MKSIQVKYVRTLIRVRRWAKTEKGERIIVPVLGGLAVLLFGVIGLLLVGVFCYYTNADYRDVLLVVLSMAVLVQMWCAMLND